MPASTSKSSFLYKKIETLLRAELEAGKFGPGDRLPDDRTLATRFEVSRNTINLALRELGQAGLVDRIQGRGSYVSNHVTRLRPPVCVSSHRYLHILCIGWSQRHGALNFNLQFAQLALAARQAGWRITPHFCGSVEEAAESAREIGGDPASVGGILTGPMTSAQAQTIVADSKLPWVRLFDFQEPTRPAPVMDQVAGDGYRLFEQISLSLLQHGCRRPVLFEFGHDMIWNKESVDAVRSVFDAAGVPSCDQQVFDLRALREITKPSNEREDWEQNLLAMRKVVRFWCQTDRWPDGAIIPSANEALLTVAVENDEIARQKLAHLHLVVAGLDERPGAVSRFPPDWRVTWVAIPFRELADAIMQCIQQQTPERRPPVRRYIRTVLVHEADAMGFPGRPETAPDSPHSLMTVANQAAGHAIA